MTVSIFLLVGSCSPLKRLIKFKRIKREVAEIVATELAEIDLETDSVEEAEVDELFTGRV